MNPNQPLQSVLFDQEKQYGSSSADGLSFYQAQPGQYQQQQPGQYQQQQQQQYDYSQYKTQSTAGFVPIERTFVGSPFGTGGYRQLYFRLWNSLIYSWCSDEPPLLEELGINFSHIKTKSVSVLNVFKMPDSHIMDDTGWSFSLCRRFSNCFRFSRASVLLFAVWVIPSFEWKGSFWIYLWCRFGGVYFYASDTESDVIGRYRFCKNNFSIGLLYAASGFIEHNFYASFFDWRGWYNFIYNEHSLVYILCIHNVCHCARYEGSAGSCRISSSVALRSIRTIHRILRKRLSIKKTVYMQ